MTSATPAWSPGLEASLARAGFVPDLDERPVFGPTRNQVLLGRDARGHRTFLKLGVEQDGVGVVREAQALRLLGDCLPLPARLGLPRVVHASASPPLLALGWLADAENLLVRHRRAPEQTPKLSRALGGALGFLHRATLAAPDRYRPLASSWSCARTAEFFFRVPPRVYALLSPASIALFGFLQGRPGAMAGLERLAGTPAPERCLVHGDVKLMNVLRRARGPLVLVDWELAHWGDPAADLGGAICDYALHWMSPVRREEVIQEPELQHILRSLWRGYGEERPAAADAVFTERSLSWAGIALLYYIYSMSQFGNDFGGRAKGLAEFAVGFLATPGRWARRLLGGCGAS